MQSEHYHGDSPCIYLAPSPLEGRVWFRGIESFGFSIWSQKLHIPPLSSVFVSPSLFVPGSHASTCWRDCTLHAVEGTQLHRCVAWLAVFSICLELTTPPGPPALMKSCGGSIWQLLIRHGASVPRHLLHPSTPPPPLLSLILSAPLKQGKLPGGGIHHRFGPGALRLTLAPQMEKRAQHNKSTAM